MHRRGAVCYVCALKLELELENFILPKLQSVQNAVFEFKFEIECTYVAETISAVTVTQT